MTAPDIYQSARAIAGRLAANRRLKDSDAIIAAMRSGCTGTEILMRLRHALQGIHVEGLPATLQQRIDSLIFQIDAALELE